LSTSIPPNVLPPQADIATANVPPWPQADVEQEADAVIESTKDSHEEEEHILQPEDDEGNDEIGEDGPVDGLVEGQEQHDPEGQMPSQLPAAATQVEEVQTYAHWK
jgi:hypothetical protein